MNCKDAAAELAEASARFSVPLSSDQQAVLARYCAFILETNDKFNLTAMRSPWDVCHNLFLDSLLIVRSLAQDVVSLDAGRTIHAVDLGSGSGIPGIPLKIVLPQWSLVLIESVGKKARFLSSVAQTLGLDNVRVLQERAETLGRQREHRDASDVLVARAVAPLPTLLELSCPLVRTNGTMYFSKGGDVHQEIADAATAAGELACTFERLDHVPTAAGLGENRYIVVYRKVAQTPMRFPRRAGEARSKPLGRPKANSGSPAIHAAPAPLG